MPLTILESLSMGLYVISTKSSIGIEEIINSANIGCVVPIKKIIGQLNYLNSKKYIYFSEKNRKYRSRYIYLNFSREKHHQSLLRILNDI